MKKKNKIIVISLVTIFIVTGLSVVGSSIISSYVPNFGLFFQQDEPARNPYSTFGITEAENYIQRNPAVDHIKIEEKFVRDSDYSTDFDKQYNVEFVIKKEYVVNDAMELMKWISFALIAIDDYDLSHTPTSSAIIDFQSTDKYTLLYADVSEFTTSSGQAIWKKKYADPELNHNINITGETVPFSPIRVVSYLFGYKNGTRSSMVISLEQTEKVIDTERIFRKVINNE